MGLTLVLIPGWVLFVVGLRSWARKRILGFIIFGLGLYNEHGSVWFLRLNKLRG